MNNEFATALAPGDYDADLLRPSLVGRVIYLLADSEDPANLVANVDGRIPLAIAWHNIIFWLDPDDTTSAQDGVTVIKTSDNYVYKVEDPDYRIRSVLSDTVTSPPGSPAVGDAYLVPSGATGGWSSHQDDIAIFTRNGWRFEVPGIGKWLLIEDVDGFKRYTPGGWLYGPGARSFDDASVPLSAALGFGERIIVENQTTNTPPTATKGLRYIVGPSPTGAWLGKAKQIAICQVAGTWTFYPPGNGWAAYDKNQGNSFTFNGTAWVSSGGVIVNAARVKTAAIVTPSQTGSAFYAYSTSSPPKTTHYRTVDPATISYASKKASAELEISFRASVVWLFGVDASIGQDDPAVLAIYRDSETDAIAWMPVGNHNSFGPYVNVTLSVTTPDALSHTYTIAATYGKQLATKNTVVIQSFALRDLSIKELS